MKNKVRPNRNVVKPKMHLNCRRQNGAEMIPVIVIGCRGSDVTPVTESKG